MADMTPDEVAAYRDNVLTSQGLTNDGTGNYYSQDYYDARPAALAANAANTAATNAGGMFAGVQGSGNGNTPVTPSIAQGLTSGVGATFNTWMPIGTSAKTYNQQQVSNLKGGWQDFLSGKRDASSVMSDMNTYGVSMSDMASTLGLTPAEVASKLGAPNGFGGYSAAPGLISGAMATPTAMTVNPATSVNSTNYTAATTPGANVWNAATTPGANVCSAAADVNASTAGPAVLAKSNPWDVTTNQTVAGQIQGLIDPNSPLIQQARTGALQQMAARGLQNSSMALTAGDSAAYTAALPIATADAGTYSKAASYNADINNQMAVTNANAQNSINVSNAAQQNQVALQNQQQKNTVGLTNAQEINKANQFDTAQKNTVGLTNAQEINKANQFDTAQKNTVGLTNAQQQNQVALANAQQQNQVALANAQQENAVKLANAAQQNNLTQAAMTTQTQKAIADLNAQTQMWSATLDANTKTSLQKLTNENSVLLKTNDTAASIMNAATAALNNIQMSGLTDKTGASAQVWQNLTAMMNVLSKTSGLDLSSMLTSNPYPASGTSQTPGGTNTTPEPPPNNTQWLT